MYKSFQWFRKLLIIPFIKQLKFLIFPDFSGIHLYFGFYKKSFSYNINQLMEKINWFI